MTVPACSFATLLACAWLALMAAGCIATPITLPLLDGAASMTDGAASTDTHPQAITDAVGGGRDVDGRPDAAAWAPDAGPADGGCLECPGPDGGDAGLVDAEADTAPADASGDLAGQE